MKTLKPVRIVQFESAPCAPFENAERMAAIVRKARADGVGLVVFPSSSIHYGTSNVNAQEDFEADCVAAAQVVVEASEAISVLFQSFFDGDDGPSNSFVFAEDGKTAAYGKLEDDATTLTSAYSGKFAIVSNEDLALGFNDDDDDADVPEFEKGTAFVVVCDNESYNHDDPAFLVDCASQLARIVKLPLFYANGVGVQNHGKLVEIYRGDSAVFDARGRRVALATPFEECVLTLAPGDCGRKCSLREIPPREEGVAELTEALRHGLRTFMAQCGVRRVVIGVSGGIDSAVSTALYGSILPSDDILLVSMPGPFTSATTRGLAHALAANLGARFAEIPIGESVALTRRQFAELVAEGPHGAMAGAWSLSPFALENVQARDRGSRILTAAAAAFGGVVSCNANKDECTVGYGTMYGDITGWLCCLGDLWKGDVYAAGRYLNDKFYKRELIPEGIFKVKPSAELSEKQAVEKGLGDPLVYPYHDALFRAWVEGFASPADTLEWYLNGELKEKLYLTDIDVDQLFPMPADFIADLERWWNLYCGLSVAKRLQAPPTLVVSHSPLGAVTSSQSGPYYGSRYRELKAKALTSRSE